MNLLKQLLFFFQKNEEPEPTGPHLISSSSILLMKLLKRKTQGFASVPVLMKGHRHNTLW